MSIWGAMGIVLAAVWLILGGRCWLGLGRLRSVVGTSRECGMPDSPPLVSIIVPARNEALHLEQALTTLVAQDYSTVEIIVVNDRSVDGTGRILEWLAEQHRNRVTVVTIAELPPGWLGKTHAQYQGYKASRGEWLLFTDADVSFAPSCLSSTLAHVGHHHLDYLTLFPALHCPAWGDYAFMSTFMLFFDIQFRPWEVRDPESRAFIGVGAFMLIRRDAYERIGTHKALALEVADDMEMGKLVRLAGLSQEAAWGSDVIQVPWYGGLWASARGLSKNLFAAFGFSFPRLLWYLFLLGIFSLLPYAGLWWAPSPLRWLFLIPPLVALLLCVRAAHGSHIPPLYALLFPLGAATLMAAMAWSAAMVLISRKLTWRGTDYSLDLLREGARRIV